MGYALKPHPATPCAAITAIGVEVMIPHAGAIVLRYVATGDIGLLRLPPPAAPTRTDELWKTTCFEAFVKPGEGAGYYEVNVAPSTQWAAYRFDSYRDGMAPAFEFSDPRIEIVAASQVVEMSDSGLDAVKKKKDSSISRAVDLVKAGKADAVVSAGHTGAAVTASLIKMRCLPGVDRPAIASVMPSMTKHWVLIDAGANPDSTPEQLVQALVASLGLDEGGAQTAMATVRRLSLAG